jgi:hypothetical protein
MHSMASSTEFGVSVTEKTSLLHFGDTPLRGLPNRDSPTQKRR